MRLPLAIPVNTRTGQESKDARLTNAVVEEYQGVFHVVTRPSIRKIVSQSGAANGLIAFNGKLINIVGTDFFTGQPVEYYDLKFTGADGSSTVTNDGTGGAITSASHRISTLHPRTNNASSLRLVTDSQLTTASAALTHSFFAGSYDISFDLFVAPGDVIASAGDCYLDFVTVYDNNMDFYRWGSVFTSDSSKKLTLTIYNDDNQGNSNQWQIDLSKRINKYTRIKIEKRGNSSVVIADSEAVEKIQDATLVAPTGTLDTPLLLSYSQGYELWSSNFNSKLFADNFLVESVIENTDSGNVTSGQFDFAQSTE